MRVYEITSPDASELSPYRSLKQPRAQRELFIAESVPVIRLALEAGCEPVSFLMARRHIAGKAAELLTGRDVPVYTAPDETLETLTGFPLTRGVLCAMRPLPSPPPGEILRASRRVCVLEGLTDASNVGSVFRAAASLGMDGVLLDDRCPSPLSRKALRVSMGAVFQVPWAVCPKEGLPLAEIRASGFTLAALALAPDALPPDAPVLRQRKKLALLLGSEGAGLKKETIAECDFSVCIPMRRGVDSLNVAQAAAIAFWEAGKITLQDASPSVPCRSDE